MIRAGLYTITHDPREDHGYRAVWRLDGPGMAPAWFGCLGRALAWLAEWGNVQSAPTTRQDGSGATRDREAA